MKSPPIYYTKSLRNPPPHKYTDKMEIKKASDFPFGELMAPPPARILTKIPRDRWTIIIIDEPVTMMYASDIRFIDIITREYINNNRPVRVRPIEVGRIYLMRAFHTFEDD